MKKLLTGILSSILIFSTASADDVEVFGNDLSVIGSYGFKPKLLIILDTSSSMGDSITANDYDPMVIYSVPSNQQACVDEIYLTGVIDSTLPDGHTTEIPTCDSDHWIEKAKFVCTNRKTALGLPVSNIPADPADIDDFTFAQIIRFGVDPSNPANTNPIDMQWNTIDEGFQAPSVRNGTQFYECIDDFGSFGETDDPNSLATPGRPLNPADNADFPTTNSAWTFDLGGSYHNSSIFNLLFTANYLHWYHYHGGSEVDSGVNRLQVVQEAATTLVTGASNVEIGLIKFSLSGGQIVYPIKDMDDPANKSDLLAIIDGLIYEGSTPLIQAIYKGYKYFQGGSNSGVISSSITEPDHPETLSGGNYIQPTQSECGGNYMIVLTDGEPSSTGIQVNNELLNVPIIPIPETDTNMLSCGQGSGANTDYCMDELANYMYKNDISSSNDGVQKVTSFYISGFGTDAGLLESAAIKGGSGGAFSAENAAQLNQVFEEIFNQINSKPANLSTSISVDASNQVRSSDDIYIPMFQPSETPHWNGNIKKYKLVKNASGEYVIKGKDGNLAVDPNTGALLNDSVSYWSRDGSADGEEIDKGGIAHRLFDYDTADDTYIASTRENKVYTYVTDYQPNSNEFNGTGIDLLDLHEDSIELVTQPGITRTVLGLTEDATASTYLSNSALKKFVAWIRGADVNIEDTVNLDTDGDPTYPSGRPIMGALLHSSPVLVNVSLDDKGTPTPSDDDTENILLAVTNDGYFHIFNPDVDTTTTRIEHVAIVPKQTLGGMHELYQPGDGDVAHRLDGNIEVWRHDESPDDGKIGNHSDDHIYAYFGQRRGGNAMFAFDITDYTAPKLLWVIDPETIDSTNTTDTVIPFRNMGQTWSTPKHHTILTAAGKQDILVFGGGYDAESNDTSGFDRDADPDEVGNAIYIVDAKTGGLLWWADVNKADQEYANMKYSIASDIQMVDVDGDKVADKFFATDLGGQVWRFDINNQVSDTTTTLAARITGGVVADLQRDNAGASLTAANNRRLFYTPDVSIMQQYKDDPLSLAIAVGTGYRAHPLNTTVDDKLFVIKLEDALTIPTDYTTLYVDDLQDVTGPTTITYDPVKVKNGWYLDLIGDGEKSLSKSITINGKVFYTSYTPNEIVFDPDSCSVPEGKGRIYAASLFDGSPVIDFDDPTNASPDLADRVYIRTVGGIPNNLNILFPEGPTNAPGTSGNATEQSASNSSTYVTDGTRVIKLEDNTTKFNHWLNR